MKTLFLLVTGIKRILYFQYVPSKQNIIPFFNNRYSP